MAAVNENTDILRQALDERRKKKAEKIVHFKDLSLSPEMLKALDDMGFDKAFPIQAETIPHINEGCDVIGLACTGTGKTAAFSIPAIEKVDENLKSPQMLVICPTRELAMQVEGESYKLTKYKKGIKSVAVYGGVSIERQIGALKRGAQVVVGTPGRLLDHLQRGTLKLSRLKIVILDEADEMLDMGFRDDIQAILDHTPQKRQTLLFSATMSQEILQMTKKYQHSPRMIRVTPEESSKPKIEQVYFGVGPRMKDELLGRLIDLYTPKRSIVFCNTRRRVDEVSNALRDGGYPAEGIHGDVTQAKRSKVMDRFRTGRTEILIATDVAARGIDVSDVEAVFNYEIPQQAEAYVHRIGRTGRAGKAGKAFNFVSRRDMDRFRGVQRFIKQKIAEEDIPCEKTLKQARETKILNDIKKMVDGDDLTKYVDIVIKLIDESYNSVDIAAALLKKSGLVKEKKRNMSVRRERDGDRSRGRRSEGGRSRDRSRDRSRSDRSFRGGRSDRSRSDRPRSDRPRSSRRSNAASSHSRMKPRRRKSDSIKISEKTN